MTRLRIPWLLLIITLVLLAQGLLFVTSASYKIASNQYGEDPVKQAIWIGIGAAAFIVAALIRPTVLGRHAYWLYALCLMAILVCYLFPAVNGAHRWIALNNTVKIQPSEFMKVLLPLVLARFLAHRGQVDTVRALIGPFLFAGIPMLLILKQPDLGTALVFIPMVVGVLFTAGMRKRHLVSLVLIGVVAASGFYFSPFIKPHQKARIDTFLNPDAAPLKEGYQLRQSKIAIGAGGPWGKGLFQGSQNYLGYLPFNNTDFIFAVIGEEWGFAGAVTTLALFYALIGSCLGIARRTRDPFGRLAVVGLAAPLAMQVVVNAGMTIGLAPITGLTLPLISYGGSSMVATLAALGLIVGVAVHPVIVLAPEGRNRITVPNTGSETTRRR